MGFSLFLFLGRLPLKEVDLIHFLNLTASQGQMFIQHITPYRGVLLSVSRHVQPNRGQASGKPDTASQHS